MSWLFITKYQNNDLKFGLLKNIAVTASHLIQWLKEGSGAGGQALSHFSPPTLPREPQNWNVTCTSPSLMIYYNFSRLEISVLDFRQLDYNWSLYFYLKEVLCLKKPLSPDIFTLVKPQLFIDNLTHTYTLFRAKNGEAFIFLNDLINKR